MKNNNILLNSNTRNVSIDILKILSMLMVVILHATYHGVKNVDIILFSAQYWFVRFLRIFSIVAVNCFILISGYFMCEREMNYKKLIHLWIQVEIYSVGVYLILCIWPGSTVSFSFKTFILQALPIIAYRYWFMTHYFLLMIVSPILNRLISNLEQKEFQKILLILLTTFCLVPSVNIFKDNFGTNNGYSLLWFCILYLVAAYIKKYPLPKLKINYGIGYILISILAVCIRAVCDFLQQRISMIEKVIDLLLNYNHILVFSASVCLFIFAVNVKITLNDSTKKMIYKISSLSLGVYLFHENDVFRSVLWTQIIRFELAANNFWLFAIYMLSSVFAIFICGILFELIRSTVCNSICNLSQKNNNI